MEQAVLLATRKLHRAVDIAGVRQGIRSTSAPASCASHRMFRSSFSMTTTTTTTTKTSRAADFTHVVIGGGVVGLAVARKLSERAGTSTLLIERHGMAGQETSSRNSEVIHAGLYYGRDSLKTRLCVRGRELMYEACAAHNIRHWNCGKWIVAQDSQQLHELEKLQEFATSIDNVPVRWVSRREAAERGPAVRAEAGVLESLSTGIVDSHGVMAWLEAELQSNGGDLAYHTAVTSVQHNQHNGTYSIITRDHKDNEDKMGQAQVQEPDQEPITAEVVVNSAGLYAAQINNMLLPKDRHVQPFYAKGTYFSYSAPYPKPRTLVYPAPQPGHGGLGTHLTLDLSNPPRVRFGPDVEWVDSPTDYTPNPQRLSEALDEIESYLPGLQRNQVEVDYCGIRPKLGKLSAVGEGKGFQDFIIRKEDGFDGFVNLLGIESPGLTSSLAIAEEVDSLLYR